MFIRTTLALCAALLFCADGLAAQRAVRRTWVIPHVLERPGRVANTPNTFDTELHMVNVDRTASVEVRVFANDGQPLLGQNGQPVCSPCTFTFQQSPKQVFSLDERITATGGFARPIVTGYVVVTTTGQVNMQGFIVNSHTSAFDLSVFGFEPQPLAAEAQ